MPSRRQIQTKITAAEERKKRQEKFRKRSGSLFEKVKKLAQDTDASVALVVRDRVGRVRSFRSSDTFDWPHSIIDLIVSGDILTINDDNQYQKEKNPSGTHEYLQKHAISACWKRVENENTPTSQLDRNEKLAVKHIQGMRAVSTEHIGSDITISVDLSHDENGVELSANVPKDKATELVECQETAAVISGESDNMEIAALLKLNVLEQSNHARVDSLADPPETTLYADGDTDETMSQFEKSDNVIADLVGHWNNQPLDTSLGADKAVTEAGEPVTIEVIDAVDGDPTFFDYDMNAEVDVAEFFGVGDSIEAAAAPSTLSHAKLLPSFGDMSGWQVVDLPRMPLPNGPAKSKVSTEIDRKELLRAWDWVFRRR